VREDAFVDHLTPAQLTAALPRLLAAPRDTGVVQLIAARPREGERQLLAEAALDLEHGLIGDNWLARGNRHTPDGSADPAAQITVMSARVAGLVAAGIDRMAEAGDQLYVDFDLSIENLPAGSLLEIGTAVLEVSATPHTGCAKFVARFGEAAMRFVNSREGRALRLRGMNARVVVPGVVRVGDVLRKTAPVAKPVAARAGTDDAAALD
jgi:hypothetical protein